MASLINEMQGCVLPPDTTVQEESIDKRSDEYREANETYYDKPSVESMFVNR